MKACRAEEIRCPPQSSEGRRSLRRRKTLLKGKAAETVDALPEYTVSASSTTANKKNLLAKVSMDDRQWTVHTSKQIDVRTYK